MRYVWRSYNYVGGVRMKCEFLINKTCQIANQLAKVDTFPSEIDCELCSKCKKAKSENSITLALAINHRFKNNLPKDKELIEKLMNISNLETYAISQKLYLAKKNIEQEQDENYFKFNLE